MEFLINLLAGLQAGPATHRKQKGSRSETKAEEPPQEMTTDSSPTAAGLDAAQNIEGKTLKDAVKPKNKRKKKRLPSDSGN